MKQNVYINEHNLYKYVLNNLFCGSGSYQILHETRTRVVYKNVSQGCN